jgi:hypothetical protein
LRYSGDIAGARIQNGFHQIINNKIKTMPYVDTDRVDGTVWAAFDRTGVLKNDASVPLLGDGWQLGYWGRGATLLTRVGWGYRRIGGRGTTVTTYSRRRPAMKTAPALCSACDSARSL